MSFLAPLFLLGALAIIGPVIFHLIRRTTREKTPFSTLMFLQPTPPRITRRSRLENIWLLLLRCLVIGLLAFAFARPFFQQPPLPAQSGNGSRRTVILLDTSASMQRKDAWTAALKAATDRVSQAAPSDEVAVATFDRTVDVRMAFTDWISARPEERVPIARQRLSGLHPSWEGTHLDTALIRAADLLDTRTDADPTQRRIVVISDLQEGAKLDGLQGYEWPRGTTVEFVPITSTHLANAGVQWIPESDDSQLPAAQTSMRVRVINSAGNKREQFPLHWITLAGTAETSAKVDAYVPAGQTRIVRPPAAGTSTALRLEGDDVEFDNTVYILQPQPARIPILFLGKESETDPNGLRYYLHRAFPKTRTESIEIIAPSPEQPIPDFQAAEAQLVVLGDSPSSFALTATRRAVEAGRIALVPLTGPASGVTLAELLQIPELKVSEATVRDYALLGEIYFQHPIFAAFSDPRFSDFTKIHFWKYRRIDGANLRGARVIAKFDGGDPAVIQIPLGRGSVMIFASGWQPSESQLALSSKFVPLLHALLEESSSLPVTQSQYFVGDGIPMAAAAQPFTIRKPDGTDVPVEAGTIFTGTDQPGIYTVTPGNRRLVVNVSPEESRLTPLGTDRFIALGVPLEPKEIDPQTATQRLHTAQAIETESRQKVWRWLIVSALGLLLLETLFAGKLSAVSRSSTVPS